MYISCVSVFAVFDRYVYISCVSVFADFDTYVYTTGISVLADLSRQAMRSVYETRWKQLVANCRGVGGGGGGWGPGDQEFKNQGLLE